MCASTSASHWSTCCSLSLPQSLKSQPSDGPLLLLLFHFLPLLLLPSVTCYKPERQCTDMGHNLSIALCVSGRKPPSGTAEASHLFLPGRGDHGGMKRWREGVEKQKGRAEGWRKGVQEQRKMEGRSNKLQIIINNLEQRNKKGKKETRQRGKERQR